MPTQATIKASAARRECADLAAKWRPLKSSLDWRLSFSAIAFKITTTLPIREKDPTFASPNRKPKKFATGPNVANVARLSYGWQDRAEPVEHRPPPRPRVKLRKTRYEPATGFRIPATAIKAASARPSSFWPARSCVKLQVISPVMLLALKTIPCRNLTTTPLNG